LATVLVGSVVKLIFEIGKEAGKKESEVQAKEVRKNAKE